MLNDRTKNSWSTYLLDKLKETLHKTNSGIVMAIVLINRAYCNLKIMDQFKSSKILLQNWLKDNAPQLFEINRAFSDLNLIPHIFKEPASSIHIETFVQLSDQFTGEFDFEKNFYPSESKQKSNALYFIRRELRTEIKTIKRFEEVTQYYRKHFDDKIDLILKEIKEIMIDRIKTNDGILHDEK